MSKIPTAENITLLDADEFPPPNSPKLLVLSCYGVLTVGTFQKGFHVAWSPLPKIPKSVKGKMIHG